ncbi:hypothetical protein BH23ACT10_BH23ACT10_17800 [soil metagenome]
MNIDRIYAMLGRRFRTPRMRALVAEFGIDDRIRVLDVGGTPFNWELVDVRPQITLLNHASLTEGTELPAHVSFTVGDGRALGFEDGEFDVVVSNSVIEHVGDYQDQSTFASEVRRVGRGLWVQAPARGFFLEPHYLAPFVHWLPRRVQRLIIRWLTPRGWIERPNQETVDEMVDEIRLPTRREMQQWFPDCEMRAERVLGMTKSHIAVRPYRATR